MGVILTTSKSWDDPPSESFGDHLKQPSKQPNKGSSGDSRTSWRKVSTGGDGENALRPYRGIRPSKGTVFLFEEHANSCKVSW